MMTHVIQTWLHMHKATSKTDASKRTKSNISIGVRAYHMLGEPPQKRPAASEEREKVHILPCFPLSPALQKPSPRWLHSVRTTALERITTVTSQPEIPSAKSDSDESFSKMLIRKSYVHSAFSRFLLLLMLIHLFLCVCTHSGTHEKSEDNQKDPVVSFHCVHLGD